MTKEACSNFDFEIEKDYNIRCLHNPPDEGNFHSFMCFRAILTRTSGSECKYMCTKLS